MDISPQALIIAGGVGAIGATIFHLFFWRLFNWPQDLKSASFINRQVIQILNICLTFVFAIFAYISITHADALLTTSLGRSLVLLIALFWFFRAAQQIWFFGLRHLASKAIFGAAMLGGVLHATPLYLTMA